MLEWFAETTVVAGLLALVAVAASKLRPIGPSIRHALWLVVLIKLVTPPLVSWPWAADWRNSPWPLARSQILETTDLGQQDSPATAPVSLPADLASLADECDEQDPAPIEIDGAMPAVQLVSSELAPEPTVTSIAPNAPPRPAWSWRPFFPSTAALSRGLLLAWLTVSVVLAVGQSIRIVRFRRHLHGALPAPDELFYEAHRIGRWLGVKVPELLVVEDLGTPLLWCLGTPQLLLPSRLLKTLPFDRWRGILTHELAHLRRRDQWVCRLELAAGLIWWWNPLYWLARARLDTEAELACDAWVVWALPKDRLSYAEVLFDICSNLSLARPMAPTLGVAGSGRFFERRLTMILHNNVPCRLSPLGLVAACLLVLFAVPSWSAAKVASFDPKGDLTAIAADSASMEGSVVFNGDDDDPKGEKALRRQADDDADDDVDDDPDDDDDDADDDDDDDSPKAAARAQARAKAAQARAAALQARAEALAKRAKARADADWSKYAELGRAETLAKRAKARAAEAKAKKPARDEVPSGIEKEMEEKFGPGSDFEKQMEELGEKIGKEIEAKFGPEFEKQMEQFGEKLGKEMEAKFGPDFEKKMKDFGKEMEAKFGPGSEFGKKMEAFGKEMEARFGPGSDFEKKMKGLGDDITQKLGPGSDFAKKLEEHAAQSDSKAKTGAKADAKGRTRERRIKELEAQIAKLMGEIESLKSSGDGDKSNKD